MHFHFQHEQGSDCHLEVPKVMAGPPSCGFDPGPSGFLLGIFGFLLFSRNARSNPTGFSCPSLFPGSLTIRQFAARWRSVSSTTCKKNHGADEAGCPTCPDLMAGFSVV